MKKHLKKYHNKTEEKVGKIPIEDIFPESLRSLKLVDEISLYDFAIDIDPCDFILDLQNFKYLESFEFWRGYFQIKNLPISLKKLRLVEITVIDFNELKYFTNLVTLELYEYSDLPNLEIKSPNLRYIDFSDSKIGKLTPERLKLPLNVLEIKMCNCEIDSIDDCFEFPPDLQVLLLDGNNLHQVPSNLPSSLKILGLKYNKFELRSIMPSFPKSLKFLNIEETGIVRYKFGTEYDKLEPILTKYEPTLKDRKRCYFE